MARVWAAVLATGALLVAWVLFAPDRGGDRGAAPLDGSSGHGARKDPTPGSRELAATEPGTLELTCTDGSGAPLHGVVHWATSARPFTTSWRLLPQDRLQGGAPFDSKRLSGAGGAELRIRAGHWTWLRVVDERSFGVYERVPPLSGRRVLRLGVDREARGIHVFVLRHDLSGPAAHATVSLYGLDVAAGGGLAEVARRDTGDLGYVRFRGLPAGHYLVVGPGSEPGERAPRTARLVLPRGGPPCELPCTLQAAEPLHPVRLRVRVEMEEPPGGRTPLMFVRRLTPRTELRPLRARVRPGAFDVTAALAAGAYELDVVPVGRFAVVGPPSFDVPSQSETPIEFELRQNDAITEVSLVGVPEHLLPLTLHVRRPDLVGDADGPLAFFGPHRWQLVRHEVAMPEGAFRVVGTGRGHFWLSDPVSSRGQPTLDILLRRATRLDVCWLPRSFESRRVWRVHLRTAAGPATLGLRAALVDDRGLSRPAWTGSIVVPQGPAALRCVSEAGRVAWLREIHCDRDFLKLDVR